MRILIFQWAGCDVDILLGALPNFQRNRFIFFQSPPKPSKAVFRYFRYFGISANQKIIVSWEISRLPSNNETMAAQHLPREALTEINWFLYKDEDGTSEGYISSCKKFEVGMLADENKKTRWFVTSRELDKGDIIRRCCCSRTPSS